MDSSHFPLFHSGQVFYQFVCPLTVVLPQIFFNLTTLFPYPVLFSLFQAPLDVVVHFLVFRSSFRLESFLSQFSPFVAQMRINGCCLPNVKKEKKNINKEMGGKRVDASCVKLLIIVVLLSN